MDNSEGRWIQFVWDLFFDIPKPPSPSRSKSPDHYSQPLFNGVVGIRVEARKPPGGIGADRSLPAAGQTDGAMITTQGVGGGDRTIRILTERAGRTTTGLQPSVRSAQHHQVYRNLAY